MRTFVDTSALYALLDEDDDNHAVASAWMSGPGADPAELLVSHNYVVVEAAALVQRRLGSDAVRVLLDAWIPTLTVAYVDERLHEQSQAAYLAALGRRVSLVDAVSFQLVRQAELDQAFAFDADFTREGIVVVP